MILPDLKLIFVHIARTGGTSVETALAGQDWWEISPDTKHLSARQTRALVGEEVWKSYFKAATVRNPWDRIISMYATGWWANSPDQPNSERQLESFLNNLKPHPHEKCGSLQYSGVLNEKLDLIIRFEELQAGFDKICDAVGIDRQILPHIEQRERVHYSTYYTPTTRDLVASIFSDDIMAFGYCFDEVLPFDETALRTITRRLEQR